MNFVSLIQVITAVELLILLFSVILWLRNCRDSKIYYNIFGIYLAVTFIVLSGLTILSVRNIPNLFIFHIYTFIEFLLLSLFFKNILNQLKVVEKYGYYWILLVLFLIVGNTIFLQPLHSFNSNAKTLTQFIYLGYALAYFFNAPLIKNQEINFLNLIISAILLYYAGSLFIFMFSKVLAERNQIVLSFWIANSVLYLIFQIMVFTGLWRYRRMKFT